MRYLFFICSFLTSSVLAQSTIYSADDFVLQLQGDSSFIFYPTEISLKTKVAGDYLLRNDSLILTTHKYQERQSIFAIYNFDTLQLNLLYAQKEFALSLPQSWYISKSYDSTGLLKQSYHWINLKQADFVLYTFSDAQNVLSIEQFMSSKLDGPQLYYFDKPYAVMERELNFKAGLLHGPSYFFKALDDDFTQVQLIKEEKYKNGILKQVKTLAARPVFYKSHF